MADALITQAELEAFLQQDVPDATAALLITLATATVQASAGQRIVQVIDDEVTLALDGIDTGTWLELPEVPVTAVTAVQVGATVVTDWVLDAPRGRLYRALGWRPSNLYPHGAPSEVTVTYTHGYAPGDQRLELARAWVLSLATGAASNPLGVAREQIDDYAVQYAAVSARMEAAPGAVVALRRYYGRGRKSSLLVKS